MSTHYVAKSLGSHQTYSVIYRMRFMHHEYSNMLGRLILWSSQETILSHPFIIFRIQTKSAIRNSVDQLFDNHLNERIVSQQAISLIGCSTSSLNVTVQTNNQKTHTKKITTQCVTKSLGSHQTYSVMYRMRFMHCEYLNMLGMLISRSAQATILFPPFFVVSSANKKSKGNSVEQLSQHGHFQAD